MELGYNLFLTAIFKKIIVELQIYIQQDLYYIPNQLKDGKSKICPNNR